MNTKDGITPLVNFSTLPPQSGEPYQPNASKTYNEYVAGKIETFPEHLVILLPYEDSSMALQIMQLTWMEDFWKEQKTLFV